MYSSAIDLTTSFSQHTNIKTAAYTGEDINKSDYMQLVFSLVVATSAFRLGVNKDNVRAVYHLGVTESWMQQAGRGGRDGATCTGTLL